MVNIFTKAGEWIGFFLLRTLLLIGALVVFSNGIYMSWNHTHDFAMMSGLHGNLAISYTMFVEVILGVSELVIIFYSFLKSSIPKAVIWGFGFGLSINLTGNILSLMSYGFWGIVTGISITIGTIIASAIFASALVRQNKENKQVDNRTDTSADSRILTLFQTFKDTFCKRTSQTDKKLIYGQTTKRTLSELENLITDSCKMDKQTPNEIIVQSVRQTYLDSSTKDMLSIPKNKITDTLEQTDTQTLKTVQTPQTVKQQPIPDISDEQLRRTNKKIANRINHLLDEVDTHDYDDHTYNTAIQYIKRHGKRPSIRGLAKLAGVKKNRAEKVMK